MIKLRAMLAIGLIWLALRCLSLGRRHSAMEMAVGLTKDEALRLRCLAASVPAWKHLARQAEGVVQDPHGTR